MVYREAKSAPAERAPAEPQHYKVLSETRAALESELNRLAKEGYKPIMISSAGSTIHVIMELK